MESSEYGVKWSASFMPQNFCLGTYHKARLPEPCLKAPCCERFSGESLLISAITVAELYAGVRDGAERTKLDEFVRAFEIVAADREISVKGGLYRRDYMKSHNVGLADALIAATAEIHQARLATLNGKHFPMLANVIIPYRKV